MPDPLDGPLPFQSRLVGTQPLTILRFWHTGETELRVLRPDKTWHVFLPQPWAADAFRRYFNIENSDAR